MVFLRWVSGRIFQIPEETIKCQPFECPDHFMLSTLRTGWNHPQAHIQLWWDKDADVFYLARVWKKSENTAVQAWGAVKSWANKIPVAWLMTVTNTKRAVVSNLKPNMRMPGSLCFLITQRSRMAVTQ